MNRKVSSTFMIL